MNHEPECLTHDGFRACTCPGLRDAYQRGRGEHMRDFDKQLIEIFAERGKLEEAIQRVRDAHTPWTHTFPSGVEETYCSCDQDMMFPNETCFTIRALDGEQLTDEVASATLSVSEARATNFARSTLPISHGDES